MTGPRFLGWRMVGVAFFVDFVAVGFFFYSYGVFFKAIEQEFGGSRLGVSLGLTITTTVGAIAAPFIGNALDRFPLKRVIAAGSISMALGFLALSQVQNQLQFYLALGAFIGFGASAMGGLATAKLVTNWFSRRRGTALGIAATGISASGVVMPFVSATLIETYGWREGFMAYGAFTALVVVPLVLRLVISTPEDVGLRPDGRLPDPPKPAGTPPPPPLAPPSPIVKDRNFWVLVAVIGLLFCCQSATLTHMVPRITDTGVSLQAASLVMSLTAGLGIAGKLSFGWLVDRWTAKRAIWFTVGCQLLGQVAMLQQDSLALFALGAALFGYGMGGVVPMQGALVAKVFGRARFGKALGMLRPGMFPLQIIGVPLAGWMYDATGSYTQAFIVFIVLYVLAALLALAFRDPERAFDD
ncbi:MAG: MFS transporter [Gammaproteobacteria bacterium]|nr:MFS transporter [Gammaproteobacteria bacterium]